MLFFIAINVLGVRVGLCVVQLVSVKQVMFICLVPLEDDCLIKDLLG